VRIDGESRESGMLKRSSGSSGSCGTSGTRPSSTLCVREKPGRSDDRERCSCISIDCGGASRVDTRRSERWLD
jgi:hypothetical protein